jgi:glycosyltransferase involved in cell wall biosynthesis
MTYNCAHLLPKAFGQIPKDLVADIIVTDDGSKDDIEAVAQKVGVPLFRHTPNRGYGGNLKEGIRIALERGADYVVEVHGDGQFGPEALRAAMPFIREGYDFIIGSRFAVAGQARRNGMPLSRYLANRFLSFFDRLILRLPFTEFHTGFRIYSRRFLERVVWQKNSDDYLFSFQIIAQAAYVNARVAEVPVEADYHSDHTSHNIRGAAVYAVQTFGILLQYVLAKYKIQYASIFPNS